MRSIVSALAWEFWCSNRRGWCLVLAALAACALLYRLLAGALHQSEGLRSLSYLPMGMSLILAAAFCNFTDRNRRNGIAGFPQHLFALPVATRVLVSSAMGCAVLSVLAIYLAWTKFVYEPIGIKLLVGWPATLFAAGMVLYQSTVWCLCSFRFTRIVCLSLIVSTLVAVGFWPYWQADAADAVVQWRLTAALALAAAIAHGVTIITVDGQRQGGGRSWQWIHALAERWSELLPRRQPALRSADDALLWIERHRSGYVLPAAVLLTAVLILGPILALTGRGPGATMRAAMWLAVTPIMLAFPIGMGFGKPDFWSLELALTPFYAARPVTGGQLVVAKLKSAAWSTLIAWAVVFTVAPIALSITCDTEYLYQAWGNFCIVYSPLSRCLILPTLVFTGMLATWSMLVDSIWIGSSGRPAWYYALVCVGIAGFLAFLICFAWWVDHPRHRGEVAVGLVPWVPWMLATCATAKCWLTAWACTQADRRNLVARRSLALFAVLWFVATLTLVLAACAVSPRIGWLRDVLILAALVAVPSARIVAAPLAVAWNRHR